MKVTQQAGGSTSAASRFGQTAKYSGSWSFDHSVTMAPVSVSTMNRARAKEIAHTSGLNPITNQSLTGFVKPHREAQDLLLTSPLRPPAQEPFGTDRMDVSTDRRGIVEVTRKSLRGGSSELFSVIAQAQHSSAKYDEKLEAATRVAKLNFNPVLGAYYDSCKDAAMHGMESEKLDMKRIHRITKLPPSAMPSLGYNPITTATLEEPCMSSTAASLVNTNLESAMVSEARALGRYHRRVPAEPNYVLHDKLPADMRGRLIGRRRVLAINKPFERLMSELAQSP
jgi:hypothetical protein